MRCALCGGEIDSISKKCLKCGECWGGGNRGVASEALRDIPPEQLQSFAPSFTDKIRDSVCKLFRSFDNVLISFTEKAANALKIKTTHKQNRSIAYALLIFLLTAALIIPFIFTSACFEPDICGKWISEDSNGNVIIEFESDGQITMFVASDGTEKAYRCGSYTLDGSLLKISYDDGETITMTFSIEKDTAVFTLLSNGQSQTYKRK